MGPRRSNGFTSTFGAWVFFVTRRGGGGRGGGGGISVADPDSVNSDPVSRKFLYKTFAVADSLSLTCFVYFA
jgi:hypothetical protein